MDAWTELTQAAIRDRIQEREAEAAGERLATTARSAAILAAAVRVLIEARRPAWTEPARLSTKETARDCEDCPAVSNAA